MSYFSTIQKRNLLGVFLFTLLTLAILFSILQHKPLIWAILFSALLHQSFLPIALKLDNIAGISRKKSANLFLVLFFGGLAIFLNNVTPFISSKLAALQKALPSYIESLLDKLQNLDEGHWLAPFIGDDFTTKVNDEYLSRIPTEIGDIMGFMTNITSNAYSLFLVFLLAPIITYFTLKDGSTFRSYFLSFVPDNIFEIVSEIVSEISFKVGAFVRARFLQTLFVGFFVFIGLTLLGRPHAVIIAIFAGVTNLLPFVGPIIGAIPPIALALAGQEPPWVPLAIGGLFAAVQLIDGFVLTPALVSRIVNIHPLVVIVSVIIGGKILGILGIVVAIPICILVQIIFANLRQIQSLS